jgi:hypothetical protein
MAPTLLPWERLPASLRLPYYGWACQVLHLPLTHYVVVHLPDEVVQKKIDQGRDASACAGAFINDTFSYVFKAHGFHLSYLYVAEYAKNAIRAAKPINPKYGFHINLLIHIPVAIHGEVIAYLQRKNSKLAGCRLNPCLLTCDNSGKPINVREIKHLPGLIGYLAKDLDREEAKLRAKRPPGTPGARGRLVFASRDIRDRADKEYERHRAACLAAARAARGRTALPARRRPAHSAPVAPIAAPAVPKPAAGGNPGGWSLAARRLAGPTCRSLQPATAARPPLLGAGEGLPSPI